MRIFVCEFITAGGMQDSELPEKLAHEGEVMLAALLDDLVDAGYKNLVCTRDHRLDDLPGDIETIRAQGNIWETWRLLFNECDAAWIIAPETNNILYQLVREAESCGCQVIGCSADTVRMATSKRQTVRWLEKHHIPAVPVYDDPGQLEEHIPGWIIKPDDGVGGEGVRYFPVLSSLQVYWKNISGEKPVIQPFVRGTPASMAVYCHRGRAVLLGCNEQCFTFSPDGRGKLHAVIVNGLHSYYKSMHEIAGMIAAALPKESAYIGVDLMLSNNELSVLELNPRLTTAYAGIIQSLAINPAGLILSLMNGAEMPDEADFQFHPVRINI